MGLPAWATRWLDELDTEFDQATFDQVIVKEYFWMLQISALYPVFRGLWRWTALFQLFVYFIMLLANSYLMFVTAIYLADLNFVLFNMSALIAILLFLAAATLFQANRKRRSCAILHFMVHHGFYTYHDAEDPTPAAFYSEMWKERKIFLALPILFVVAVICMLILAPFLDRYGTFNVDDIQEVIPLSCYQMYDEYVAFEESIEKRTPLLIYNSLPKSQMRVYILSISILSTGFLATFILSTGLLMFIILSQNLIKEYNILIHKTTTIDERAMRLSLSRDGSFVHHKNDTLRDPLSICFKEIYEHHMVLVRFANEFLELASSAIFIVFSLAALMLALAVLTTIFGAQLPGTAFTAVVVSGLLVAVIYLITSQCQQITNLSEDFREMLYSIKWYDYSKCIKSSIAIMQTATSKPFVVTFYGMMPASLETFAAIMNSAYSFYNIIVVARG